MKSHIVKPEKFDHLYLVYYFTVPSNQTKTYPGGRASNSPIVLLVC